MEPGKYVTIQGLLAQGNKYTEDVETSKGVFQIRPMTVGERAEIQVNSMAGIKSKTTADIFSDNPEKLGAEADVDIDFTAMQTAQWEAKIKVLAYGLSVGKQSYKPDTIKKVCLTNSDVDILHKSIMAISEVTPDELVPFRQDGEGKSDGPGDVDGGSTS